MGFISTIVVGNANYSAEMIIQNNWYAKFPLKN